MTKHLFFILSLTIVGCAEQNKSEELSLKIQRLKNENDSIRQLLDSQINPDIVSYETVLKGTTFLPNSSKIIGLLNNGIEPINFQIIEACEVKHINTDQYPKFINIKRTPSTLIIDVEIIANACHNFLGEAEVVGDETLHLIYTNYGGFCSWGSCTLRYIFDTSFEKEHQILRYVTINGSEITGEIPTD